MAGRSDGCAHLWRVLTLTKREVDRRTFLKRLGALGLAVAGGGFLEACVTVPSTPRATVQESETPKGKAAGPRSGGTLVAAWDVDPGVLDPASDTRAETNQVLNHIFETLMFQDLDSTAGTPPIIPKLATSWQFSSDGLNMTVDLRKGVKFHDGTPFNAEAAKFNLDRATDKGFQYYSNKAGAVNNIAYGPIVKTEVLGDHSIRIHFQKFNPYFTEFVGVRINAAMVSPESVKKWGNDGLALHPIGTGPFKFVEQEKDTKIVLEKNVDYWNGQPHLDRIIIRPIPDGFARVVALQTGEVDFVSNVPADSISRLQSDPNLTVMIRKAALVNLVYVNHKAKPWTDRQVRQAANYAINREVLAQQILNNTVVPAGSLLVPGSIGYDPGFKHYTYDPEKARALLKEAGYQDGFETTFQAPSSISGIGNPKAMLEFIQQNLAQVGIRVKFEMFEPATFVGMFSKGMAPDIGGMIWQAGSNAPVFLTRTYSGDFAPPKGRNLGAYDNPEVESLMKKAAATVDEDERLKLFQKADRTAVEDGAFIYLVSQGMPSAFKKNVKGFVPPNSAQFWLTSLFLEG